MVFPNQKPQTSLDKGKGNVVREGEGHKDNVSSYPKALMESHQLNRLETAVHNVTKRLMLMSEKVVSIERELARRRTSAARRRNKRQQRVLGPLTIPEDSFRPDERLPYMHWARVCFEFGLRGMLASEFCRWVVVEWIRQYKLHARKKVLSLTSGRIRYFAGGVQVSCAEVDMFGRKHLHRRKHEVHEILFWDWCSSHMRCIGQRLRDLPGYESLPTRFRTRIDFAWAPYSEMVLSGNEYDPENPRHQTPQALSIVEEIFTRGFRKGIQNQAPVNHDAWLVQRNIKPLVSRAEMLDS